jgi:hypothetical protein
MTNTGFGTLATGPAPGDGSIYVTLADLNGDGKLDLVEATGMAGNKLLKTYTNIGNGIFNLVSTNLLATVQPGVICSGDLNGDGKVDIVVPDYNSASGTNLFVLTNDGRGVLGSNATWVVAKGPRAVVVADVNGDGSLDLASAGGFGGLSVLTNDGYGRFSAAPPQTLNAWTTYSLIAADLNADGRPDLVSGNPGHNCISVLINTSTFPAVAFSPRLDIKHSKASTEVSWPSRSVGWSLFQSPSLTEPTWAPSGYAGQAVRDDGTNCSLTVIPAESASFFRLQHP